MAFAVRLTVITGPHRDHNFCFCGPARCQIGRAIDCFVQLSGAERDVLISRHHCQLEVDPPATQVRDLGSTNGTYVNGHKVDGMADSSAMPVRHGDLLTVGGTTLRVEVLECPYADQQAPVERQAQTTAKRDCSLPCHDASRM